MEKYKTRIDNLFKSILDSSEYKIKYGEIPLNELNALLVLGELSQNLTKNKRKK